MTSPEPNLYIEVRPGPSPSGEMSRARALPERFADRAGELADAMETVVTQFRERLRSSTLDESDDEPFRLEQFELSFSVELQAESGVIIARTAATGAFSVSMTWERPKPAGS